MHSGIVANPSQSTAFSIKALKPLNDIYGLKRIIYSANLPKNERNLIYQGTDFNRSGNAGIIENLLQIRENVSDNQYTQEEISIINETRGILGDDLIGITSTVSYGNNFDYSCDTINIELKKCFDLSDIKMALGNAPGVMLQEDFEKNVYPLVQNAVSVNCVIVGRIRRDYSVENGLNLWVLKYNCRKSLMENAVQIALRLMNDNEKVK